MPIRFVIDETLRAVGKALVEVRDDVISATMDRRGRVARRARSGLGMDDEDWLPIVGSHGWVVITRDKHIRTRPGEVAAVKRHGIRPGYCREVAVCAD